MAQVIAIEKYKYPDGVQVYFFIKDDRTAKVFTLASGKVFPGATHDADGIFRPPPGAVYDRLEFKQ